MIGVSRQARRGCGQFDGPSPLLASGAPTGATLLKRRHLELLGHALVSVPYWEWSGCKGAGEREPYLKSKLAECGPSAAHSAGERVTRRMLDECAVDVRTKNQRLLFIAWWSDQSTQASARRIF